MHPTNLGVVGLGAIGGSVAWQAADAGVPRVLGYSTRPKDGVAAVRAGAVTELVTDVRSLFRRADFVVLAAPPAANLDLLRSLREVAPHGDALCTDVTSVKQPIMQLAVTLGLGARFAGSHPFTGTHAQGFTAARPDRFTGTLVYITATPDGDRAAAEVADFWKRVLGAEPVMTSADQHDRTLAWTSHLPQAVASALAAALAAHVPPGIAVGPGARDTMRLAAGGTEMWTDVLMQNRGAVVQALEGFEGAVRTLHAALEAGDAHTVAAWLEGARRYREGLEP